jgi:hypothetical protein
MPPLLSFGQRIPDDDQRVTPAGEPEGRPPDALRYQFVGEIELGGAGGLG